ncbi:cellulose biosynthesis protein BcsD [Rahnella perminowiae]|uniref:cellulose biosynthesis protein BcsD n=1 Tax=Rahnella perminowiae TaxID=2816244 RepID=UPI00224B4947|nr:cellulose biosynthesis protein BcsD [Rahnella perminowiae]MCX2943884.1 cellulose synthase [Rahnella perminowiae]
MQEHSYSQVAQEYYRQRHTTPGWQSLVQVLFSGILASADDEDGRHFLTLMGNNLARQHPLPGSATLGELEDNINQLLRHFDWGVVKLEATQQQLALVHIAWPVSPQGQDDELWSIALISLFEGLYAEWLLSQGGQPYVPLRWQESTPEGAFVFRYQNGL